MLQFLVSSLEKVSSLDRNKQEMNTPLMERQRATERGKKNVNGKYDLKIMAITFYGLGYIFFTSRTFTKNKKVTF